MRTIIHTEKKKGLGFMNLTEKVNSDLLSSDELILESLVDDLAVYDIYDVIMRISALNLIIENQNKSILFDALIAGILAHPREHYQGKVKISSGKFRNIINKLESMTLNMMIDPAENTFIERVRYYGNYWIFPGINYSPAYSLQGFLNVLCLQDLPIDKNFLLKAHRLINFVLQLSNTTAKTLDYDINSIRHVEQSNIKLPDSRLFDKLKNCVYFKDSYIKDLIGDKELYDQLFTNFKETSLSQIITGEFQEFFAHPFLRIDNDTIILLNTSVLVPFAIHHIVLLADAFKCKNLLIDAYNNEIWKECKKDLRELGHKKILESRYGIELIDSQHHKEEILTVGNDKILFVHFICDSGIDYDKDEMFGQHIMKSDIPDIYNRFKYFINKLSITDEKDCFQIIILNSFGRTVYCKTTKEETSYSIKLTPQELHCIAVNERDKTEFIPRYIAAKRNISKLSPPMMGSELNSIEIYKSNDYSFYLSDDYNPKNTFVFFALGDSLDYVISAVKKEDRQLVNSYDGMHLCDVILNDSARKIYINKGTAENPPELVEKFNNVNIWFTEGKVTSIKKAKVLHSIIDTISYWIAEAREIIETIKDRKSVV